MKILPDIIIAILLVGQAGSAVAEEPKYLLDPKYEFGRIPLGVEVDEAPKWAVKVDCDPHYIGLNICDIYDADGIKYNIFDGAVCEKTFVVTAKNASKVPYGIDVRRPKDEIIAGVSKRFGLNFVPGTEEGSFGSDDLESRHFDDVGIFLNFNKRGSLRSVKLWSLCV